MGWAMHAGNTEETATSDWTEGLTLSDLQLSRCLIGGGRVRCGSLISPARQDNETPDSNPAEPGRIPQPVTSSGRDRAPYALRLWLAARTEDASVGSHPYAVGKGIAWVTGPGGEPVTLGLAGCGHVWEPRLRVRCLGGA